MKELGYRLFAMMYYIYRLIPIKKNRCFLIMTHDASVEGNVGVIEQYLKKSRKSYDFRHLVRSDTRSSKLLSLIFKKSYELATSNYIFMDNTFLPLAFIKVPKSVSVVQLWHGTGTIKKFGQDVNTGKLKVLEGKANENITHLIVNSPETRALYSKTFQVPEEKVYVLGLPRTDILFSKEQQTEKRKEFYQEFPELKEKKLILYAPTFRDDQTENPKLSIDLDRFVKELPKDHVLALRLHPHVARYLSLNYESRIIDFSLYENLNTLLFASDILITDYSSIVFEYSILQKPMIFYTYDLEVFSKEGRGFYEPYESYVPGNIAKTTEELITIIKEEDFQTEKIEPFCKQSYSFFDGKSTYRVIKEVMKV